MMILILATLALLSTADASIDTKPRACEAKEAVLSENGFDVKVSRFSPASTADKLVVIMPPTGGTNPIDLSYAESFCKQGIASVVVNGWTGWDEYSLELAVHDRFYRRGQRAIDLVLARAPEEKIGILGTSVGAIHASIASRRSSKISSVFLIVGGGGIANILTHSDQQVLVDGKAKRFETYGFRSDAEYEAAMAKVIPFEPLQMEPVRRNQHIGMVISHNDGTVPTSNQIALKNAFRPSIVIDSDWGHVATVMKTWLCDSVKIIQFFADSL